MGDRNRRYVSLKRASREVDSVRLLVCPGHFFEVKFPIANSSHIDNFCPRRADFKKEGILGKKLEGDPSPN